MILSPGEPARIAETQAGLCFSLNLGAAGDSVRWAWLSDTHIARDTKAQFRKQYPLPQFERVVAEVLAVKPAGALINGDIACRQGGAAEYALFELAVAPLRAVMPLVLSVGNHDCRQGMLRIARRRARSAPNRISAVVDQPPFRFIVLDSQTQPQEVGGAVGAAQLAWLDATLADSDAVTLLFLHHPRVSASAGCADFDALLDIASAHPQVKAIVTGHDHEFRLSQAQAVHLIALPAVGFTFHPRIPTAWVEAALNPRGARLRLRDANGNLAEHVLTWRRKGR